MLESLNRSTNSNSFLSCKPADNDSQPKVPLLRTELSCDCLKSILSEPCNQRLFSRKLSPTWLARNKHVVPLTYEQR